jgi:hypothetical protein
MVMPERSGDLSAASGPHPPELTPNPELVKRNVMNLFKVRDFN